MFYVCYIIRGDEMDRREVLGRDSKGNFVEKQQKSEIIWSIVLGVLAAVLTVFILR